MDGMKWWRSEEEVGKGKGDNEEEEREEEWEEDQEEEKEEKRAEKKKLKEENVANLMGKGKTIITRKSRKGKSRWEKRGRTTSEEKLIFFLLRCCLLRFVDHRLWYPFLLTDGNRIVKRNVRVMTHIPLTARLSDCFIISKNHHVDMFVFRKKDLPSFQSFVGLLSER